MVTLPPEYTATKYFGYFWNTKEQRLYSIKMGGILRPMVLTKPNFWNKLDQPVYRVSVNGQKRWLDVGYLKKLTTQNSTIPVEIKCNG